MLLCSMIVFAACRNISDKTTAEETSAANEVSTEKMIQNTLTEEEKTAGWKLLFDGKSADMWRNYGGTGLTGWEIKDGELIALGLGNDMVGDIITKDEFENFEFSVEWKLSPGANSGIFFNVVEEGFEAIYHTGPEYQLIDDENFHEPLENWQITAANYAMHRPALKAYNPVGEYNHSILKVNNGHVQHWLNGKLVVAYDLWSEDWHKRVNSGKWKDFPSYGLAKKGKLGLQDHGNMIWFRNIKVREL